MKRLAAVIEFAVFLSQAPASAQDLLAQANSRATPPVLKLLENQWTINAPSSSGYTLEFLRTAARESAQFSPKDAVLNCLYDYGFETGNENAEGRCQPSALLK